MTALPVKPLDPSAPQRRIPYDPARPLLRPFLPEAAAFRAGTSSPRAFLEACIGTMERDEPALAAFVAHDLPAARRAADAASARWAAGRPLSPVDGMPFAVKDMIETAELPTQMNSPIYAGFQARRDAAAVAALRQAGAVVLGKTVTTEFACGNSGPTRNPYDTARTPGGSSSGSAAAVGAGMAPLGLGTQTHASTLRPASYCGAYALKASFGALPTGGLAPLSPTLDHLGLIGAGLEDVWAAAIQIARRAGGAPPHPGLEGPEAMPPARRPATLVRLDTLGWAEAPASSQAAFEAAVARLAATGIRILDAGNDAEVAALEAALRGIGEPATDIMAWETRWPLMAYRDHGPAMLGARPLDLLDRAAAMTPADYRAALAARQALRDLVAGLAGRAEGFVLLAASGPAVQDHAWTGSRNYPMPWTLVGGPAFALPVLEAEGLPLGLQLAGFTDQDAACCAVAAFLRDTLLPR